MLIEKIKSVKKVNNKKSKPTQNSCFQNKIFLWKK